MEYIQYRGLEGKKLDDASVICIATGTKITFKSVKSFKRYVTQYVYKYIDNSLSDKSFISYRDSELLKDYINSIDINY